MNRAGPYLKVATMLMLGLFCVSEGTARAAGWVAAPRALPIVPTMRRRARWPPGRRPTGATGAVVPARPAEAAVVLPAEPAEATAPAESLAEQDFNSCKKAEPGKRRVEVSLKPDTDVGHLITWISSITCKAFVLSASIGAERRHITIVAPSNVTPEHAFRIFLEALDSVGLTVERFKGFYQVIESMRAKTRPIPLYDWDGHRLVYGRR